MVTPSLIDITALLISKPRELSIPKLIHTMAYWPLEVIRRMLRKQDKTREGLNCDEAQLTSQYRGLQIEVQGLD